MTRLALAGCTERRIAALTGHAIQDLRSTLDAHCRNRDPAMALDAIRELETRTKTPDRMPARS